MVYEKMQYQRMLARKETDIKVLAERIIAAQTNLTNLYKDQINHDEMLHQQELLDLHLGSISDRSTLDDLIVSIHKEMEPSRKSMKVFPDSPPKPGYFPTIGDYLPEGSSFPSLEVKSSSSFDIKENPPINVSSPKSSPVVSTVSTKKVTICDLTGDSRIENLNLGRVLTVKPCPRIPTTRAAVRKRKDVDDKIPNVFPEVSSSKKKKAKTTSTTLGPLQ